jgi:benzodiazapine receptor
MKITSLQILVVLSTLAVIVVNALAAAGKVGGVTPKEISDKYPTYLTPAGFTFTIWSFIYLGLILFTIYQALPSQRDKFQNVRAFYLLSCAANCIWIWLWHHYLIVPSVGAMLVLLASLAAINFNLARTDSPLVRVPFGLYFGWVTIATIVNIVICFKSLGVDTSLTAACVLIATAAVVGVIIRLKIANVAYGLAVAWGILGIALNYGGIAAISVISIFAIIGLLIAAITPFLRLGHTDR